MLGAALGFVAPWNAVAGVLIVVVQTMAGLCFFALARRFLTARAALFGAACYAANPCALLIVYMRSDFAEQLACAVMPLVVLTALQLCGVVENRRRSVPRAIALFVVAFASTWPSDGRRGVIDSIQGVLLFASVGVSAKSW